MTDPQRIIYQSDADRYEALIAREDYQGNILRTLEQIVPDLKTRFVLDLGAGTGRLARLLAPRVKFVRAFDESDDMLRVCRDKLSTTGFANWSVDVADHRHLPVNDASAHLVVSGWSVSYLAVWGSENWREKLTEWLDEMKRVLTANSPIILFKSLGTGMSRRSAFRIWQISISGWKSRASRIRGSALITNSNHSKKPKVSRAFSLAMKWGTTW